MRHYLVFLFSFSLLACGGPGIEEDCQDGIDNDGNGLIDCQDPTCSGDAACASSCGNGVTEAGEVCDDGNNQSGDGCRADCLGAEQCGDSLLDQGEECDNGDTSAGDGCDENCVEEICGDGIVNNAGQETCDDGNNIDGDGCDQNCTFTACGNNLTAAGEECDNGNNIPGDGCNAGCFLGGGKSMTDKSGPVASLPTMLPRCARSAWRGPPRATRFISQEFTTTVFWSSAATASLISMSSATKISHR